MTRKKSNADTRPRGLPRREFLTAFGTFTLVAAVNIPGLVKAEDGSYPPSRGYLLVDQAKCQGCLTCMLACSLAHHGLANLSLARIQVVQDSYGKWPDDIGIGMCRQCVDPGCVKACPEGALIVDAANGNVRRVDKDKCIGCMTCVFACPFPPSRSIYNTEEGVAEKCDLCLDTPHWGEKGGPAGKQACVEFCPVKAIKFVIVAREQKGDAGYEVNLRGKAWEKLGYPKD